MTKGLKQTVVEAIAAPTKSPPVSVSPDAYRTLAQLMRKWSGWRDATLVFGLPSSTSPIARTDTDKRQFVVNVDALCMNPNRVINTVTPFRLKQEAPMTGAMLHEAGHARHSKWREPGMFHTDGTDVTPAEVALATLMEEPRIEGLIAREAPQIGAAGLAWTMRAMNAKFMPLSKISSEPMQQIMDVIKSWALRAGKAISLEKHTGVRVQPWVNDFTQLLHNAVVDHIEALDPDGSANADATKVIKYLMEMACGMDKAPKVNGMFEDESFEKPKYNHADTGPWMVDKARDVLTLLFPETSGDEMPEADGGCEGEGEGDPSSESEAGQGGEGSESGEQGEGNTEPEDEGNGEDPGAGDTGEDESDEQESGEGEGQPEDSEPEEGDEDGEGATGCTDEEGDEEGDEPEPEPSELQQALTDLEQKAGDAEQQADAEGEEIEAESKQQGGNEAGQGGYGASGDECPPSAEDRDIQRGAEKFLRGLIEPSESSRTTLTDQPSSSVDGAAMAAWKAGGQRTDPRFFKRTHRSVLPSPPIKIALLVDVSGSMNMLQRPSALLSWALAAASLDMQNFAGRGQQIESCLIHWGSWARVIQHVGDPVRGLREWECTEGTSAMHEALGLVEAEMPDFFDGDASPANRLLVQFTDWRLDGKTERESIPYLRRGLASGMNMLTVVPRTYSSQWSDLPNMMSQCEPKKGVVEVMKYDENNPGAVWTQAAQVLA